MHVDADLALKLLLALAIGTIVGVERGWREREAEPGSRTAGVRTYALSGLLGGVSAALAVAMAQPLLVGFGLLAYSAVFAWFKRAEAEHDQDFSVTGTVAGILVFVLGAYAVAGNTSLAAAGAIVTAGMLASREALHGFLAGITWRELRSALLLLAMTGVILPVLPDSALDPYDAINPRRIWLVAIVLAGISYLGYVGMRALGERKGTILTGLTGGLVSSTAVTITFARRASKGEARGPLVSGAAVAAAVSILRVAGISFAIEPALLREIAPFAIASAVVLVLPAIHALRATERGTGEEARLGNPFELRSVLFFAFLLAAIGLLTAWGAQRFGAAALYPTAALSGLVDVDAVTVSTARLAGVSTTHAEAGRAILIAVLANGAARVLYAGLMGRASFALGLGMVTGAAFLAGLGAWLVLSAS